MSARIPKVLSVLGVFAVGCAIAVGCGPEGFASITLKVREPAGVHRRQTETTNLFVGIDAPSPRSLVSFAASTEVRSNPIELGQVPHDVFVSLRVGNELAPSASGTADPLRIPSINDVEEDLQLDAPILLARPNRTELLDDQRPTARTRAAVCMESTGEVWFIGGFSQGAGVINGYAFALDDLLAKETILTDLIPGQMACDASGDRRFVLVESACAPDGTVGGVGRVSIGNDGRDLAAELAAGLCDPRVSVVGDAVWIVGTSRAELRSLVDLTLIAAGPVEPHGDAIAIDSTTLLYSTITRTRVVRPEGTALTAPVDGPIVIVRKFVRDAGLAHALLSDGTFATLTAESLEVKRTPDLKGITPTALRVLRDGRLVAMDANVVVIEGSEPTPHANRDGLAVTVGGAALLVGGGAGTDVLIPE